MKRLAHLGANVFKNSLLFSILLFAVFCLDVTLAVRQNPLKYPTICGRPQCDIENEKFAYKRNIYKYDYEVKLSTEFSGTGQNTSDLYLKAKLEIIFPRPCEGFLKLNALRLFDQQPEDDLEIIPPANSSIIKTPPKSSSSSSSSLWSTDDDDYDYYAELEKSKAALDGDVETSTASTTTTTTPAPLVYHRGEHPKSRQMEKDLIKNVLRFSFHDGLISEVCPELTESTWALNIKKGILSAFQNTMLRFDFDYNTTETDISGTCNVQYSLDKIDDVFVGIRKVKDMKTCRSRYSTHSVLQTTPYVFRDDKSMWPILDSESDCSMTLDSSIYLNISCFERHQMIPFSNGSTGAVTTSMFNLTYTGQQAFLEAELLPEYFADVVRRSTLLFDHTPAVKPTHARIKASRDLLMQMCASGFPRIQREFIEIFTQFLQATKSLDYKALTQLLARSASICDNGKNHVLESLPYVGSTASYQVMRDQIVANAITKDLAHNWMTSLSFIQFPDEETLETFFTIMEFSRRKLDPEYTLGASAVVHSFCRNNDDCADNLKVMKIINLMETEFLNLYNMYRGERRSRERMIVILKGLGNIGVMTAPFAAELEEIITDHAISLDIRLNAVMAFRRSDCMEHREFFLQAYGNYTLNSEVRIMCYLQAMRCPDYLAVRRIKTILEFEEINQVGSYVWSHLTNLAKSSSPIKIEVQGLLLSDDLSTKFRLDIRKFSRNYEHSLFFDDYNIGTTTDLNLIFGLESFMPRMATLNFTTELFGQAINFFEFSARAEGFETLVSQMFGPKGPLNKEVVGKKLSFLNRWLGNESSEDEDALDSLLNLENIRFKRGAASMADDDDDDDDDEEVEEEEYEFEEEFERVKRGSTADHPTATTSSPSSKAEATAKKNKMYRDIDAMGYKLNYDYKNPKAQIGLRIFGNDLRFYTIEGMMEFMAFVKEFDPFEQIARILSGKEVTYSKSRVLLDASYNVPLAIGLPLAVNAFGASTVDFRVAGNFDRLSQTIDWHFDLEGKFKPSVSVDMIMTMHSDMYHASSGIKVKSNLYTNSEIEAKLKVRGKNLVSFTFDLPQDKNEIFSARSELLVMHEGRELPQAGIETRKTNSSCTWPVLDKAFGLQYCSSFSVPDLANSTNKTYPSLLLTGPTNFSVNLKKSDITAKKYVFEYTLDELNNDTDWSMVFYTPGSAIKRLLIVNVTKHPETFDAKLVFDIGNNTVSAGCNYNADPYNKYLDIFLDTNKNRSFDLNMELRRFADRSAAIYKPKLLMAVNGVNVTGLIGTVRINEKNGISQNDFEVSFETKKLQAIVKGNFIQSEITTSTNVSLTYRFQSNKIENLNFEGKLINMGDKSKTEYRGNMQMKSSAYPKLNYVSNVTWLSVQGHTEGKISYNNAPDLQNPAYTSSMRVVFARQYSEDFLMEGARTRASFEILNPRSNVDFKISMKHEERFKNGTEHIVVFGLRHAPEKETVGMFSVHLPRKSLFAVDAYMNLTVPEFNSCTARLKITEVKQKDYAIHFNGSWFTGHSIGIRSNYKDKSSRIQGLHQLKLIAESPSFNLTSVNVVYRRTQMILFADIQSQYGNEPYGLTVAYNDNGSSKNSNAQFKLKVIDKNYWLTARMESEHQKLMQLELHLDKLRDVHLKLSAITLEKRKELSAEFKWDANRDPTQRLGLLAELNDPGNQHFDGNLMVTYPERTISCGFETFTGGPHYYGSARASWSINEMIRFSYDMGIMPGKYLNNWVRAELTTPFKGWQNNSFHAGVYHRDNLYLANTSMIWADGEVLEFGYHRDYFIADPILSYDVYFGVNSTLQDIPIINVHLKHWRDKKKYDTLFHMRYRGINDSDISIYSVKSLWEFTEQHGVRNVSGTMFMASPYEGYRKGGLVAKFSTNDRREIRGAASLDFDIREFTLAIDGYARKFSDNMLSINITTPLERYRTINGRFGLNEKRKHVVAEVRSPSGALGIEILLDILSLINFDVILSVAAPLDDFEQAAVIAKMKPENVDLRAMWNHATLGFTGIWRKENITNFEYSYKVFTPLPGLEENGFVAKLVKKDVFICHFHGKFSNKKLGVRINGMPKSKLLTQLGSTKLELELLYDDDFQPAQIAGEDEDYDMSELDYDEFLSYFVDFEVDTIVWPTVTGMLDIQEILDYYLIVGNVQLPQGRVDLKDRLYFPDYINVLNVLTVTTPFPEVKELKSIVEYHVDLNYNFFYDKIKFILLESNATEAKILGIELNYTKIDDSVRPKQHLAEVNLQTPLEHLKDLKILGRLEMEENVHKGNISARTAGTFFSMAASVETEENFAETSVGILLETDVVPLYAFRGYFKKDFSEIDNTIDISFRVTDNEIINELEISTAWENDPSHLVNCKGKVQTTMLPLRLAETSLQVTKGPNPQLSFDLGFLSQNGLRIDYGTRASKKDDIFHVEVWTPIETYRNISMHGSIVENPLNPKEYKVTGNLYRNMATYGLNGIVRMADNYPADTRLRVQPHDGGRDGIIELSIIPQEQQQNGYNFQFSAIEDGKMCQVSGGYSSSEDSGMDFSMLIQSTLPEIKRINFNGRMQPKRKGHVIGDISLETPWKELGIESVKLHSDLDLRKNDGSVAGEYRIGENIGRGKCIWSWVLAENLKLVLESYMERPNAAAPRIVHAGAMYMNPNKSFAKVKTGLHLNVDSKWTLDTNGTLNYRSKDDFQLGLVTALPLPIGDRHNMALRYRGNLITNQGQNPDFFVEGKYLSQDAKDKYLGRVSYRNTTDLQGLGHVEWGKISNYSTVEGDFQMLRKNVARREFYAKLKTPKFSKEDTFYMKGSYDVSADEVHSLECTADYPASQPLAAMDITFKNLSNMHGFLNGSTPFLNVSWLKLDFNFSVQEPQTYRYCQAYWPNDTAFFKMLSTYDGAGTDHNLKGKIEMEIPLATRHRADVDYDLNETASHDNGELKVIYNEKEVLKGIYNSIKSIQGALHVTTTDVSLHNDVKPLGIHYVNHKDAVQLEDNSFDMKHVEVYDLKNSSNFNLTGELHTTIRAQGQEIKVLVIHPNRTVVMTTNYEENEQQGMKHRSKLELSQSAWIGYNVEMSNFTLSGNDARKFLVDLSYPRRNLSSEGWYSVSDYRVSSDISFKWNNPEQEYEEDAVAEMKAITTAILWEGQPLEQADRDYQTLSVVVGHPALEKNITMKGNYSRGPEDLLRTDVSIDYSYDEDHYITFGCVFKDLSQSLHYTNYTFRGYANHPASNLEVIVNGTLAAKPSYYKTESYATYRKSYYPETRGKFLALLDLERKEIDYERATQDHTVKLWLMPTNAYPIFGLNATMWDTPDMINNGYIIVDFSNKKARAEVNLTDDGSQNLQLVGNIPDARSAFLDIWRNYEEIRVVDVASYLKINHSRLITGKFHWRPAMKKEIKDKFQTIATSLYDSMSEGIDFWIKTVYAESVESIQLVWDTAKRYNDEFFDDINRLQVLEEDLEEFRIFVNKSYEANDFYIKTISNFTLSIVDELAIRDHIGTLPKIFSELWQAMGDSGKTLRHNIAHLVDTIKKTYGDIVEVISKFFHGDALEYLADLMEKGIEKYDKFVKDLHIKFIKYVENLWNKFWDAMGNYWRSVLKKLEPHFFKFMSELESTLWDLSKDLFDFIYKRTNELAESPYFNKVSSFTQDIDRLYKDIKSHDAITNIRKYSVIVWDFIKEKYFKVVPFGKELNEVFDEIWEEIKQLKKLEHINVAVQKYEEFLAKLDWIGEELQLDARLHQLYAMLANKLNNYANNALETSDMYREAKTKFIFDPETGIMDIEQKLPMSWHSFNETPRFEEIPEYKFLAKMQGMLSVSNSTFIKDLYNLRTHLDPKTWLPPYYSRALILDSRHYMTFDQSFVGLNLRFEEMSGTERNSQCSYLLTHDFYQRNFTLMLEPSYSATSRDIMGTRKLSFIANGQLIEIDLGSDLVSVNGDKLTLLPLKLDAVTISRELDILTISSDYEFSLSCNFQYDLCWIEVSGWYIGRTAGVLGKMNNEDYDEFTTSHNVLTNDTLAYTDSWSVRQCKQKMKPIVHKLTFREEVKTVCNYYFKSGMLAACSDSIDAQPFYEVCLDLASNSNDVSTGHPANKGACTAALAYIEACAAVKIPMRVPDQCVFCQLINGSYVPEGTFVELSETNVPRSSDVVFIVEAKNCNANLNANKNMMSVVTTLEEQLKANRITNNRYAVVTFGGAEPFDKPRSIYYENSVFTHDATKLSKYFAHIATSENSTNNDILQAISTASRLNFRPGVSKTFILLSCSNCAADNMKFDYSSILQFMLEEGVNLHILADTEFEFEKTRKLRHFFGLDRNLVYSKRFPEGDVETRKQLHIPRSNLGICTPLALETNGSVFSARKLIPERRYPIKRFSTIFAKRVAQSAVPAASQTCECSGHNTGVSYMACSPSSYAVEKAGYDDYDLEFSDWAWDDEEDNEMDF